MSELMNDPTATTPIGDIFRFHAQEWESRRRIWEQCRDRTWPRPSSWDDVKEPERSAALNELIGMAARERDGFLLRAKEIEGEGGNA